MKCPCEDCEFLNSCPDMYACPQWVEWAMEDPRREDFTIGDGEK